MSIEKRKHELLEKLRTAREQKQLYEEALQQAKNAEQQLLGAITVLEQMEREESVDHAPAE